MKALFVAIRNRDTDKIIKLIGDHPELVNSTAKQPPKKDEGQSPLQVAFKSKNFWAVEYFLTRHADVNFIDTATTNAWRMPVLHDAVMAVITLARVACPVDPWDEAQKENYFIKGNKEHFDKALLLLKKMVALGADVNATDSYGNTVLMRACADVEYRWPHKARPLAAETIEDVRQVFDLLMNAGANVHRATLTRKPITETNKRLLQQLKIVT